MGLPLLVLYLGALFKWVFRKEEPSLLVVLVALTHVLTVMFHIGATK